MQTQHWVTLEVDLQDSVEAMQYAIETELEKLGQSCKWVVADSDRDRQVIVVEALVVTDLAAIAEGAHGLST